MVIKPAMWQTAAWFEELKAIEILASAAELVATCKTRIQRASDRLRQLPRERNGANVGTAVAIVLFSDVFYAWLLASDGRICRIRRHKRKPGPDEADEMS